MEDRRTGEERRASPRVCTRIETRFFFNGTFYAGTIANASENGMLIKADRILPPDSFFIAVIKAEPDLLKIIATVKRTVKTEWFEGMGVELLHASKDYLMFVRNARCETI